MTNLRRIAVAAFFIVGMAATAWAQDGVITGKVTDPSGAVVPGVTLTVTSTALLVPRSAVTDEQGSYRFGLLPPGAYTVKFELQGFGSVVREGIQLTAGSPPP